MVASEWMKNSNAPCLTSYFNTTHLWHLVAPIFIAVVYIVSFWQWKGTCSSFHGWQITVRISYGFIWSHQPEMYRFIQCKRTALWETSKSITPGLYTVCYTVFSSLVLCSNGQAVIILWSTLSCWKACCLFIISLDIYKVFPRSAI